MNVSGRRHASVARCVYRCITIERDTAAKHLHDTAGTDGITATGIQRAAGVYIAAFTNQTNDTAGIIDSLCTDQTIIINNT